MKKEEEKRKQKKEKIKKKKGVILRLALCRTCEWTIIF